MLANERHTYILNKLQSLEQVRIKDLSQELNVSEMTIHRDLKRLEEQGLLRKIFGGAASIAQETSIATAQTCAMCAQSVSGRTAFIINCQGGKKIYACCPHCGLMLLDQHPKAISAMATDFMRGTMVNVQTASFVLNPDVTLCCTPSVFCFAKQDHAEKFQRGFGGELHNWQTAIEQLHHHMTI